MCTAKGYSPNPRCDDEDIKRSAGTRQNGKNNTIYGENNQMNNLH